jgi:hypothetical protein
MSTSEHTNEQAQEQVNEQVQEQAQEQVQPLAPGSKLAQVLERLNAVTAATYALLQRVEALEQAQTSQPAATSIRDRGPTSTRDMSEEDARAIMLGAHASASHRKAAEALGLSYGQVYSARNGYTFKGVYAEAQAAAKAAKQA